MNIADSDDVKQHIRAIERLEMIRILTMNFPVVSPIGEIHLRVTELIDEIEGNLERMEDDLDT